MHHIFVQLGRTAGWTWSQALQECGGFCQQPARRPWYHDILFCVQASAAPSVALLLLLPLLLFTTRSLPAAVAAVAVGSDESRSPLLFLHTYSLTHPSPSHIPQDLSLSSSPGFRSPRNLLTLTLSHTHHRPGLLPTPPPSSRPHNPPWPSQRASLTLPPQSDCHLVLPVIRDHQTPPHPSILARSPVACESLKTPITSSTQRLFTAQLSAAVEEPPTNEPSSAPHRRPPPSPT
ncbi:hypothetical protein EX30DRAFT_44651 [Ascodesmis nigricans]|uniref:Uncharacterized protein n=1 Tax=Ascodesmis nigricans TaxID=341454 RepID=A0A4S2MWB4_9PEZI|nr:hypothetical protein EX30DRAFT_44651 [Ascodesmis nigricans]